VRGSLRTTLTAMLAVSAQATLAQKGAAPAPTAAPPIAAAAPLDSATLAGFRWRNIGPANMGGRVADVVGIPSPSKTFYVAAAGGGIWKTTNAGTTFRPVFDDQRVISMGALAIAPSDTNQVWAGTGEQNSRNSISPGGGIYKSTDGGKSWKLMGLEATQQIARIVVHPTNPDIVYVAALGHAWGPNKERGLYKTTDGGKTWQLAKFISDKAGFVDVAMDPRDPNTLYASSYERVRGPWFLKSGGPGSGLWKTTDAGATWKEIRGNGFPTTALGRIGLAISLSNPSNVYAEVEADTNPNPKGKKGVGTPQPKQSGVYHSADAGASWTHMNDKDTRPFYYSQIRVDPKDANRIYFSSTPVNFSEDGGKTVRRATQGIHVDHHAMWIDPNDPQHFIVGDDGGISQTWDRGGNYDFMDQIAIGQFYEVSYDMAVPYRVCGGLQDNGSWCGPSRKHGSITNGDWFAVGGGDGFYTAQDPTNPNIIYAESQGGAIGRLDASTGERLPLVKPGWKPKYTQWEDSVLIERGDTTKPSTKGQTTRVTAMRASQRTDSIALDLRYNWNTPFFISAHSPTTLYYAGNRVLKSTKRGEDAVPISPDLSTQDIPKIRYSIDSTGGITLDATGAETYGTVTALAESPIRPGLLYAGTDDGNVWLTRNDGGTWENLTGRFPGVPAKTYVVRIEPSHADSATFYVAFDNHRVNDFTPYLYVTNDFGKTFRSIVNNLPKGGPDFLHVIREDPVNRDLLFVGTDVGAYVSRDRGASWQKFMTNLPTVPVHDLKIHPREHDLIAATHGRAIWIVDIAPLEQMRDSVMQQSAWLFTPTVAHVFGDFPGPDLEPGHKHFQASGGNAGAEIVYRLTGGEAKDSVKIGITNAKGDTLKTLSGPGDAGVHHVSWDLRLKRPPGAPLSTAARRDSALMASKVNHIIDSVVAAKAAPKATLDRLRERLLTGGSVMEFFRSGGGGGKFQERPGESALPKKPADSTSKADTTKAVASSTDTTARASRDTTKAGGESSEGIDPDVLSGIFDALRAAKAMPDIFSGPPLPYAASGDYLVTMTAGQEVRKQILRVERER